MTVYGKDFAAVYDETWFNFSARAWPFISEVVRKRVPGASAWLDLCCGTGHLLEILVREGFFATFHVPPRRKVRLPCATDRPTTPDTHAPEVSARSYAPSPSTFTPARPPYPARNTPDLAFSAVLVNNPG